MSSKNNAFMSPPTSHFPASSQLQPRSLRLRLVLWYGALLTVALVFFAVLVWVLTTDALNQSVESSVRVEARIVGVALNRELTPTSPYWPAQLSLQAVNMYQEPGVVFQVIDAQRTLHYDSDRNTTTNIPISADTARATLAGQTIWYTAAIDNVHVRVEALPLHAPVVTSNGGTTP